MSKMFETLGPLGLKWCFSKITDPKIIIFELKKQKKKKDGEINPKKKKVPTKNLQAEFFSKLNRIKRKKVERYKYWSSSKLLKLFLFEFKLKCGVFQ